MRARRFVQLRLPQSFAKRKESNRKRLRLPLEDLFSLGPSVSSACDVYVIGSYSVLYMSKQVRRAVMLYMRSTYGPV